MAIPACEIPIIAQAIRSGGASKRHSNGFLMEYCRGENSRLCNERINDKGCATVCFTPEGYDYAIQDLESAQADGLNIAF